MRMSNLSLHRQTANVSNPFQTSKLLTARWVICAQDQIRLGLGSLTQYLIKAPSGTKLALMYNVYHGDNEECQLQEETKWSICFVVKETKHLLAVKDRVDNVVLRFATNDEESPLNGWGQDDYSFFRYPTRDDIDKARSTLPDECSAIIKGTVYKIANKKCVETAKQHTVFIPNCVDGADNKDQYCQSNYFVHTCFLIRDRYIQRALLDHPTRSFSDIDTMHERWYIVSHPLYNDVHQNLVNTMQIDGLGNKSLPPSLSSKSKSTGPKDTLAMMVPSVVRHPPKKQQRKDALTHLTKQIIDIAAKDAKVYTVVIPQLTKILHNSVLMSKSESKKVTAAKDAVADNDIVLPLAPQTVKRSAADDVNLANVRHPGVKRNKHRGKHKRKKLNGTTMPLLDDQLVST